MGKYALAVTGFLFSLITSLRLLPFMHNTGYDFFSTMEQYPHETASSYGTWYWLANLMSVVGLPFELFWISISIFFGWSVYFYLKNTSGNINYKQSFFLKLILFVFLFGYILPWFSFAHLRYGTAVLITCGALNLQSSFKKKIFLGLAVATHSLIALFIILYYLIRPKYFNKLIYPVIILLFFFAVSFREVIFTSVLKYLAYANYTNDLLTFEFSAQNYIMVGRAVALILITTFLIKKSGDRKYLFFLDAIYLVSAILTPFSGRFIEFIYPNFLLKIENRKSITLILLFGLLLIESLFSISRVVFHYEF